MSAGQSPFLQALLAIQEGPLALWITQSSWALFFFLIVHTLSMGLLAGSGMAISARLLGAARAIPLARVADLFPLMAFCAAIAAVSGVFLVIGYPAKALTNPVFYAKLAMVVAALGLTARLARGPIRSGRYDRAPAPGKAKAIAALVIGLWLGAITAGRLLAYTQTVTLLIP